MSYETVTGEPFGPPKWLERELMSISIKRQRKSPVKTVTVGLGEEPAPDWEDQGYFGLWCEYVAEIVRRKRATETQAERALKRVPAWFKRWASVLLVWEE